MEVCKLYHAVLSQSVSGQSSGADIYRAVVHIYIYLRG